jgi:hypothetical protein
MLRPSLTTAAIALLGASALAQGDLRSRLQPITSPLKNAGVYHVATGTWTRNGQLSNLSGPSIIYNNSCSAAYYSGMISGEKWQHRSRIPTTAANGAPTVGSAFYGPPRNDEAPGCDIRYLVNGFQVLYCSSRPSGLGTLSWDHEFANSYTSCGTSDMVPTTSFNITGLPAGTSTGQQNCWIVNIDLDAVSAVLPDRRPTATAPTSAPRTSRRSAGRKARRRPGSPPRKARDRSSPVTSPGSAAPSRARKPRAPAPTARSGTT